jgi:antagonist of KipI
LIFSEIANFMIEVIKPGIFTTVQDLGRWGYQRYGIGTAGALDSFALTAGNLLLGNGEEAAGLEITFAGPLLKFHQNTLVAITGADLNPRLNGQPLPNWTVCSVSAGSILSFGPRKSGVRAYLTVWGGIAVPPIMGSRSTYLLGHFGGLEGRPLKAGDLLPLPPCPFKGPELAGRSLPISLHPAYQRNPCLRVILGPFADYFSAEGQEAFLTSTYTITPQSDRMGYRLHGTPITRAINEELITCGLANGTMQVPPDGQPILLLADRQTIGGYPIIATVINADLPLAAQCAPGDKLRFQATTLREAQAAFQNLWGNLRRFLQSI